MSTFPRGYMIDKDLLVRKWRAEGLIVPDMWRPFEEMAEEYFSKLVDRGIIHYEVLKCCQVDYFMLEFLASVSARKNFVATSSTLDLAAGGVSETRMLQRLSLHQLDPDLPMLLEKNGLFSHPFTACLWSGKLDPPSQDRSHGGLGS
jgi:disease resistance protein RPM1